MVDYLASSDAPGAYGVDNKDDSDGSGNGEANPAYEYKISAPTPTVTR